MDMTCILGRECGLCFTRRDIRPLTAGQWRTLLGPVALYESDPDQEKWRDWT